jgi:Arm DNA-binding domain
MFVLVPFKAGKIDGIYDGIFLDTVILRPPKDTVMALTDTRIRNAKPSAKAYKVSDGGGMYLLVKPDGGRYWRLDYRFAGKRRTLALGVYPIITLSEARLRRQEARRLLAQNIDPGTAKKAAKRASKLATATTFEGCTGMACNAASQASSAILGPSHCSS